MKFDGKLLALIAVPTVCAFGPSYNYNEPKKSALSADVMTRPEIKNKVDVDRVLQDSKVSSLSRVDHAYLSKLTSGSEGKDVWEPLTPIKVQGNALKTWPFKSPYIRRVLVSLVSDADIDEGRHIMANIKTCQGPDNTPQEMDITIEKGKLRPFKCAIETPGGASSIFVRNTGQMEYPIWAAVEAEMAGESGSEFLMDTSFEDILQGGNSVKSYGFGPSVEEVKVVLKTDGRPMTARVELIQGPNSNKEVIEIYVEDGMERPFCTVISTPGTGNVIRIINTATVEYPMRICAEAYKVIDV